MNWNVREEVVEASFSALIAAHDLRYSTRLGMCAKNRAKE